MDLGSSRRGAQLTVALWVSTALLESACGAPAGRGVASAGGDAGVAETRAGGDPGDGSARTLVDPGTGDWVPVPSEQVASVCGLDPGLLAQADATLGVPWAIVRHGRLCHSSRAEGMSPEEAWSATKTLGALVAGAVSYETAGAPATGPGTGPLSDLDRVDKWISGFTYNPDAHVAHVMAMVAQSSDLSLGHKTFQYDTIGTTQINSLSDILNAAIRQDPTRLGGDLEQFTQRFVFGPLGMKQSQWNGGAPTKVFAYSWNTTVFDMARIGLLMLNGGVWSGNRLLEQSWVYRMTHPAFEDANTGYGYLTWLNASDNHNFGGIPISAAGWSGNQAVPRSPGGCAPVSMYPSHPHGLSDSRDCNYDSPYTCAQTYDVGVWNAVGLGGQNIQGHPGLDLVIVAKDLTPTDTGPTAPGILWDAVRPAIVAADPSYRGDDSAFCAAYGANAYAPDLH
jgi:hypothetical protein